MIFISNGIHSNSTCIVSAALIVFIAGTSASK